MTTATQLLQQYTFEPVTTTTKFEQHTLAVQHQDRAIPFGHFKLRLKNIDSQQDYDLELKQRLQLTATSGFQLRSRLHGVRINHAHHAGKASYQVHATLVVKRTPKSDHDLQHAKVSADCLIPVSQHVAKTLPDQVPLYVFTDSHKLTINQTAMAKLFLKCVGNDALAFAS
ncbi:hypothetical protein D1831_13045 [Lactiplantibacillus garii]|uniref:Uncharacterized protein n=1 Tax=Lactiplantibacillus garii TaxID=2306423 RepID=A0A426D482_9LACO|nr:hypothetical protein [Lactiplantibacillus garii]RRK09378.1 hypothetical protein D1831_13045 [Lactiplantibacillus garii]